MKTASGLCSLISRAMMSASRILSTPLNTNGLCIDNPCRLTITDLSLPNLATSTPNTTGASNISLGFTTVALPSLIRSIGINTLNADAVKSQYNSCRIASSLIDAFMSAISSSGINLDSDTVNLQVYQSGSLTPLWYIS